MPPTAFDNRVATTFGGARVRFYHAENLRNFSSYCAARALLSRSELMSRDTHFTRFYSDSTDAALGVLARVFGNIYDFGSIFARANNTIPNVYGPITLVFKPAVFAAMSDIAITPMSIVTHGADWSSVRVADESVIDEIASGDNYGRPVAPAWYGCELSCEGPSLAFGTLEKVIVEPIEVCSKRLLEYVTSEGSQLGVPIIERPYRSVDNRARLNDLVAACEALPEGILDDDWSFANDQLPPSWSNLSQTKRNRLLGWCRYFYFGTLAECRHREFIEQLEESDDRTVCEQCDPGEDQPTPLVNYHRLNDGGPGRSQLDVGYCDWCNGISVRCNECGVVHGVSEDHYDEDIACDGGCGTRFRITRTRRTDGGPSTIVEVLDEDEAWHGDENEGS